MSLHHGRYRRGTVGFLTLSELQREPLGAERDRPGPEPCTEGPTPAQRRLMALIDRWSRRKNQPRYRELADELGVSKETVRRSLFHIRLKGLIEADGLQLTPAGRAALRSGSNGG